MATPPTSSFHIQIVPPPPPPSVSNKPDHATKKGMKDHTGKEAEGRVLFLDLGIFKYGTDDKAHAASVAFSIVLLTAIFIVIFAGMLVPDTRMEWVKQAFTWLGSTFLFIAGYALGGRNSTTNKAEKED